MRWIWFIFCLAVLVAMFYVAYALNKYSETILPADSDLYISEDVKNSNANIELTLSNKEIYTFNPHCSNNNFFMNSACFRHTENGKLKKGYNAIEFKLTTTNLNQVYLSYNNVNYYDVNGKYYTGQTNDTKVEDDSFKLMYVSNARWKNEYTIRFELEKYYEQAIKNQETAMVSISYLGAGSIDITDISYIDSKSEPVKKLEILSKGLTMDETSYGFKIKSGIIETNAKLENVYFNCNELGVFDIDYDEYKVYTSTGYVYRYKIKEQQLSSERIFSSDTTVNIDVYVVYQEQSNKIISQTVNVKGYNTDFNVGWIEIK